MKLLLALLLLTLTAFAEEAKETEIFDLPSGLPANVKKAVFPKAVLSFEEGPIWDAKEYMNEVGFEFAPEDTVLLAPGSRRLFVRAAPETLRSFRTEMDAGCGTPEFTWVDLEITITKSLPSKQPKEIFRLRARSKSGIPTVASATTGQPAPADINVRFEPVVGPDFRLVDVTMKCHAKVEGLAFQYDGQFTANDRDSTSIWETESGGATYSCTVRPILTHLPARPTAMPSGPGKEKLTKDLEAALEQ